MTTPADITPEQVLIDMRGGSWLRAQDIIAALDAAGYDIVARDPRPATCPTCGSDDPLRCERPGVPGHPHRGPARWCCPDPWHGGAE